MSVMEIEYQERCAQTSSLGSNSDAVDAVRNANVSPATARRIENTVTLVRALASHEMDIEDIAGLLKLTSPGARRYVRDLRDANVIEMVVYVGAMSSNIGRAAFRLSSNSEHVRVFLANVAQCKRHDRRRMAKETPAASAFHILQDELHPPIRVQLWPVQRDPLVTALFGPAGWPKG